MNLIASISKEISSNNVVNTKVSEVRSHQPEAILASSKVTDPLTVFKECVNGKLLDLTKEFNAKLTIINNRLLQHSNKLNNLIPQDLEREFNVLRKENLELKEENSGLNESINNLSYILADLQDKAKRADDEKNSLVTTIQLLHNNALINHSLDRISSFPTTSLANATNQDAPIKNKAPKPVKRKPFQNLKKIAKKPKKRRNRQSKI